MASTTISARVARRGHGWPAQPRIVAAAALALLIAGCGDSTSPAFQARPAVPSGWTTIEVGSGDIRMVLPPWLVPFESRQALFANEPPATGTDAFLELHAEGPRTLESQPGPGEPLDQWLANRIGPRGPAPDTVQAVGLPIGPGVRIDRVAAGEPGEPRRISAYAIRTNLGVAFLVIDGPAAAWPARESDAELIPMLMELGPG